MHYLDTAAAGNSGLYVRGFFWKRAVCVRDRLTSRFCQTLRWLGRCSLANVKSQCCRTCSARLRTSQQGTKQTAANRSMGEPEPSKPTKQGIEPGSQQTTANPSNGEPKPQQTPIQARTKTQQTAINPGNGEPRPQQTAANQATPRPSTAANPAPVSKSQSQDNHLGENRSSRSTAAAECTRSKEGEER
ncbi:hypothetical protein WMY93_012545 [Mugilogobius chulae]|uniref:PLAC domain-containing protein n=1 Tax=Mugilogobius chulae TaxID=88201 RepID=A0AAW0P104_9GOBI